MAYNGIAWPGVDRSIKFLTSRRSEVSRALKVLNENQKEFKRPKSMRTRLEAAIADYDTALKVLRDVKRAAEAAPRKRRIRSAERSEVAGSSE